MIDDVLELDEREVYIEFRSVYDAEIFFVSVISRPSGRIESK